MACALGQTAPVVGQVYAVPCVLLTVPRKEWVPILGPLHDDAEVLRFPWPHYHYDPRFLTEAGILRALERAFPGWGIQGGGELAQMAVFEGVVPAEGILAGPVLRPRRCLRPMPGFSQLSALPHIRALEAAHKDQRACGTCPHRGLPLHGLPVEKDGAVTCRGHGLRWHCGSGALLAWQLDADLVRACQEGQDDAAAVRAEWAAQELTRDQVSERLRQRLARRLSSVPPAEQPHRRAAWYAGVFFAGRALQDEVTSP